MATASSKIVLSGSRDIPFNKLVLSQKNVRRVKAGVSVEQLAEDIARRTLLQSLSVRPLVDGDGKETGNYCRASTILSGTDNQVGRMLCRCE
jgi:ParB family chromosome partitioning protein